MRSLLARVGVCAALALLTAAPVWAQSGTASLTGRVTDPQGAVIPGATVTVTHRATGAARTTVTNESGVYQLSSLPPGMYEVTIELSGFRTARLENIELRVDTATRLPDVRLEVGALAETVTVQAESPIINTTDASVGNVLSEQQIRQLPVEARNVVHLLSLQPGAVFIPTTNPNTVDPRYGAVAGARADQQNVTLDGVDVNDPQLQAAYTSAVRITQEALQEFRVSTSNYGAESGRSSGPQVSLVTRSGTNQFNGSAYWFLRRTATSSNEYFTKLTQLSQGRPSEPPRLDKDIFGGALGGPIRRNRFFFFGNFEGLRENSEDPVVRAVPSRSFRDGVLMYRCANAAQCPGGTVRGFSETHTVPAGWYGMSPAEIAALDPLRIGPSLAASQYFKQFPLPNEPGRDGVNIAAFRFSAPIKNDFKTYITRFDFKLTETGNHNLFVRANAQDDLINGPPQFPGQPPRSQTTFSNFGVAVGYDAVLRSNLMNSFRYGLTRIDTSTLGVTKSNWVSFRFFNTLDGSGETFTSSRETPTHNFVNDISWLKGTHTFKFGTNLRFTRIPSSRDSGSYLSATVNPSWVPGIGRRNMPGSPFCTVPLCSVLPRVATGFQAGYADGWLNILGVLSQATLRVNYDRNGNTLPVGEPVRRKYASDEYELYVQDSWQIRPSLTVTAGIRYSLFSPPYEVNGLQVAPSISMGQWFEQRRQMMKQGIPSNQSPIVTFDLAGPKNGRRGFYDWDTNNWAPRISVAWTPRAEGGFLGWLTGGDRLVVRGGYSKVFDRLGQGLALNFDQGFAFGMSTTISSPFGLPYESNPAVRFRDTSTLPPTLPAAPPGGFPQTPPIRRSIITQSIDDTIVTPSAHMINAVVGRELQGGFAVEAGYIGRFGRDLLIRRDLAMPLDLVDPRSGMSYFQAAQQMIRAAQAAGLTSTSPASAFRALSPIPYWENLFPGAAGGGLTATQAMALAFMRNSPDYITALQEADQFCEPACSIFGPFAYFAEQYDSLAAVSSVGRSNYHAMVLTLRKRYSQGYQFDLNYTLSESKDHGSQVERGSGFGNFGNGGYTGFLLNSWEPDLHYSFSDFDVRHQINFNWIADLPFGRGRKFGSNAPAWANHLMGDWSISGLVRWTSGFPFNVINCRSCWPTNWNLQGNAELATPGQLPPLGTTRNAVDGRPSPFRNPQEALKFFRFALPGEVGIRNLMRGDGYYTFDVSVSKAWSLFKDHRLRFRWDTFNVTNTPKFNVSDVTMLPDSAGFGRYDGTLATCDGRAGRCMQFALRYEF
ncbi:MAG TPA: carboxypeptidase-like regulatory domain-containing protein [Vicinamibacterales bacterium]|nr:carboxypeptidase-like regulatory domain-containing protein [Vicinamibacterales bacterium]